MVAAITVFRVPQAVNLRPNTLLTVRHSFLTSWFSDGFRMPGIRTWGTYRTVDPDMANQAPNGGTAGV